MKATLVSEISEYIRHYVQRFLGAGDSTVVYRVYNVVNR